MPNVIKSVANLFLNAFVAWLAGLVFISATLYFSNSGADFTITDIMGFGVMAIVASGILMLLVYLPSLYWLKRRSRGVGQQLRFPLLTGFICNLPVFIILALLINRKMAASEAIGFMLTFLVIGASFGYGFARTHVRS